MSISIANNSANGVINEKTITSSFAKSMLNAVKEETLLINEKHERKILEYNSGKAQLFNVGKIKASSISKIYHSIHGLNDSPKTMDKVNQVALDKGYDVFTLVYDDLGKTMPVVNSYVEQLTKQLKENPNIPLVITAHSKGARISHAALGMVQKNNPELLEGREITQNLVNGYMGGSEKADYLDYLPDSLIDGIDSISELAGFNDVRMFINLKEMGKNSNFQKLLNNVKLPNNVKTNYIANENDLIAPFKTQGTAPALKNANIITTINKNSDPSNLYPGHTADISNKELINNILVP